MLLKRRSIFYFRWQIPLDLRPVLGRRELVKSLRTDDRMLAECRAVPLRLFVREILSKRSQIKLDELSPSDKAYLLAWEEADRERLNNPDLKELTEANYSEALESLWSGTEDEIKGSIERFPNLKAMESYRANLQAWLKTYEENLQTDVGNFSSTQHDSLKDFISDCQHDLVEKGYRLPSNLGSGGEEFLREYLRVRGHINQRKLELLDERRQNLFLSPNQKSSLMSKSHLTESSGMKFSEVYKNFLNSKINRRPKPLSEKEQNNYRRYLSDWNSLMPDKNIGEYTKKDIKNYLCQLRDLPVRNKKPYVGLSVLELVELDIPDEDFVTPKTVGQQEKWLQGVFRYAINEDQILSSPATNLGLNLTTTKSYGNYRDEEVLAILNYVQRSNGWQKWVVYIAAYTGMRRTEIVQLNKDDFLYDTKSSRYYFLISDRGVGQRIKSEAARRRVPVHDELINLGVIDFVESKKDRLFDIVPKNVTDWYMGKVKLDCGIPDYNELGKRLVFHSFRTTVVTKLRGEGVQDAIVQQIVGHEKTSAGITDKYTNEFPVDKLVPAINMLNYDI